MMMALVIFALWVIIGLVGMIADSNDFVRLSYILLTSYLAFIPFIPWVLHWCGLF